MNTYPSFKREAWRFIIRTPDSMMAPEISATITITMYTGDGKGIASRFERRAAK